MKDQNGANIGGFLLGGTAVGMASSVGTGVALSAVGFTSGGVAAGSIAAGMQASIGAVQAGSAFATAQSMGATGAFFGPAGIIAGAAVGLGIGAGIMIYKKIKSN
jgi:hypothetical protein